MGQNTVHFVSHGGRGASFGAKVADLSVEAAILIENGSEPSPTKRSPVGQKIVLNYGDW